MEARRRTSRKPPGASRSGGWLLSEASTPDDPRVPVRAGDLLEIAGIGPWGRGHKNVPVESLSVRGLDALPGDE